jgi:hypothetical protein
VAAAASSQKGAPAARWRQSGKGWKPIRHFSPEEAVGFRGLSVCRRDYFPSVVAERQHARHPHAEKSRDNALALCRARRISPPRNRADKKSEKPHFFVG